jgi:predicted dehydrogenase
MDRLKFAVIGAGSMARRHLQVLQSLPDVEVVAASSRGAEKLEKLAKDFGIPQTFRNNEQMLTSVKPDAVIVAASVANMHDATMPCIEHGLPTLLEKPPGLTSEQTEDLLKTSQRVQGQYMVGLNRRFYSAVENAKKTIHDSGGLVSVVVHYAEDIAAVRALNFHPPEVLEHWMAADGMHCIDLLRVFGGDVSSVHALSSAWRGTMPNSYGALIRFKSGAIGHFISNWTSPGRWEVTAYGFDLRVDLSPLEEGRVTRRGGIVEQLPKDDADPKFKPGFYRQDKYFVDHVKQNEPIERPAANLEDAYHTMQLVDAIAYSRNDNATKR